MGSVSMKDEEVEDGGIVEVEDSAELLSWLRMALSTIFFKNCTIDNSMILQHTA